MTIEQPTKQYFNQPIVGTQLAAIQSERKPEDETTLYQKTPYDRDTSPNRMDTREESPDDHNQVSVLHDTMTAPKDEDHFYPKNTLDTSTAPLNSS